MYDIYQVIEALAFIQLNTHSITNFKQLVRYTEQLACLVLDYVSLLDIVLHLLLFEFVKYHQRRWGAGVANSIYVGW